MSRNSASLTTTERYILAQLLACGKVTPVEYENAVRDRFSRTVREETLDSLHTKGYLHYTLYNDERKRTEAPGKRQKIYQVQDEDDTKG